MNLAKPCFDQSYTRCIFMFSVSSVKYSFGIPCICFVCPELIDVRRSCTGAKSFSLLVPIHRVRLASRPRLATVNHLRPMSAGKRKASEAAMDVRAAKKSKVDAATTSETQRIQPGPTDADTPVRDPPDVQIQQSSSTENHSQGQPVPEESRDQEQPMESEKKKGKRRAVDGEEESNSASEKRRTPSDKSSTASKTPLGGDVRIRKLAPQRPYPTVPASVSATGPRSAHVEGKNYICITRKTPLGAYLRRCKDVVLKDGCVCSSLYCSCTLTRTILDTKLCTYPRWALPSRTSYNYLSRYQKFYHIHLTRYTPRSGQAPSKSRMKLYPMTKTRTSSIVREGSQVSASSSRSETG